MDPVHPRREYHPAIAWVGDRSRTGMTAPPSNPPFAEKNFARRMPGETDRDAARLVLYAPSHRVEAIHFPPGCGICLGERNRSPAIIHGRVDVVMPDFAVAVDPADHDPWGPHQRVRGRCRGKQGPATQRPGRASRVSSLSL